MLCFAFFIFAATTHARQISNTEAENIASAFYQQRLMIHNKSTDAFDISDIVEIQSAEHLVAYAVNIKNGGLVLVLTCDN
ncbi:MAG: hypothetical protein K0B15_15135 [Lentimicrobium sp.]|nr:hypothetical protein [Lentimicrobium sp.]